MMAGTHSTFASVTLHVSSEVDDPVEPDQLPAEWASLKRPVTWTGKQTVVPLGVATPVMEGAAAVLIALTSEADRFRVDTLEMGTTGGRLDPTRVQSRPAFAWWAEDDCGGWYLGQWQMVSDDETSRRGDVTYYPAIDPRARTLTLYPTLRTTRAVIEVPLPWEPAV
jgi:hypothetical protein